MLHVAIEIIWLIPFFRNLFMNEPLKRLKYNQEKFTGNGKCTLRANNQSLIVHKYILNSLSDKFIFL